MGTERKTPVRLIFTHEPLKNLFASGSQRLTGQARLVLVWLRCSVIVSISNLLNKAIAPSTNNSIGNVNLDKLAYLGKILLWQKNSPITHNSLDLRSFYRSFFAKFFKNLQQNYLF